MSIEMPSQDLAPADVEPVDPDLTEVSTTDDGINLRRAWTVHGTLASAIAHRYGLSNSDGITVREDTFSDGQPRNGRNSTFTIIQNKRKLVTVDVGASNPVGAFVSMVRAPIAGRYWEQSK